MDNINNENNMDNQSCDIIQDLLPLYIDGVCSAASKALIKEHLLTCEKCRDTEKIYRENAFTAEKIEIKQIDGLKKIKSKMTKQNIISYITVLLLAGIGAFTFIGNGEMVPEWLMYLLFGICIASVTILVSFGGNGTYNEMLKVSSDEASKNAVIGRYDIVLAAVSICAAVYEIFIIYYCISVIAGGKMPFGLEARLVGPFLGYQLAGMFVVHLAVFIGLLAVILKRHSDKRWLLCINLTGISLSVIHMSLLRELSSVDVFVRNFSKLTLIIIFMGTAGAVINLISAKKRRL